MVAPEKVAVIWMCFPTKDLKGRYGVYEAIDYYSIAVAERGKTIALFSFSFMGHHLGD